jgi:hypothetical protein
VGNVQGPLANGANLLRPFRTTATQIAAYQTAWRRVKKSPWVTRSVRRLVTGRPAGRHVKLTLQTTMEGEKYRSGLSDHLANKCCNVSAGVSSVQTWNE